ncbi:MAG: four helix bundle protein [Gemmatimonadaceae bacterium]
MHNFRKLTVWSRARFLATDVFESCAAVTRPDHRMVTAQLKRSALSISANIAEGCGKGSRAEAIRYLEIACGSAAETEHHLIVASDLAILPANRCVDLAQRAAVVQRMVRRLIERFPADQARRGEGT